MKRLMKRGLKFIYRVNPCQNVKNKFEKVVGSMVEVTLKVSDRGALANL